MIKNKYNLPEDAVEVGRILGAWGVKGSIRVAPYSAEPDALFTAKTWYLAPAEKKLASAKNALDQSSKNVQNRSLPLKDSPLTISELPTLLNVTYIREQGASIVVDAPEIADRDMAQALKGGRIFISRAEFPELEDGEFYWVDLIGLQVINKQNEKLGQVVDLLSNGPQSILKVCSTPEEMTLLPQEKPKERLIPFVDAFVGDVDFEEGIIHVDWAMDF